MKENCFVGVVTKSYKNGIRLLGILVPALYSLYINDTPKL
jgi:hypothetical protein